MDDARIDQAAISTRQLAESLLQQTQYFSEILVQVTAALQQIERVMKAEKKVVRDKEGKVVGVAPVDG